MLISFTQQRYAKIILKFWIYVSKGTEAALWKNVEDLFNSRKQSNYVFLPNFSKFLLMFWVRSCGSGSQGLSFGWTGPITRGPSALASFRPQSQIDVCKHNSTWTVACVAPYTLEQPAGFDLRVTAALWCCCWPLHVQFATHNYFCLLGTWIVAPARATFFSFFLLQLAVNNCRYYKCQLLCLFVYIRGVSPGMRSSNL